MRTRDRFYRVRTTVDTGLARPETIRCAGIISSARTTPFAVLVATVRRGHGKALRYVLLGKRERECMIVGDAKTPEYPVLRGDMWSLDSDAVWRSPHTYSGTCDASHAWRSNEQLWIEAGFATKGVVLYADALRSTVASGMMTMEDDERVFRLEKLLKEVSK